MVQSLPARISPSCAPRRGTRARPAGWRRHTRKFASFHRPSISLDQVLPQRRTLFSRVNILIRLGNGSQRLLPNSALRHGNPLANRVESPANFQRSLAVSLPASPADRHQLRIPAMKNSKQILFVMLGLASAAAANAAQAQDALPVLDKASFSVGFVIPTFDTDLQANGVLDNGTNVDLERGPGSRAIGRSGFCQGHLAPVRESRILARLFQH